MVGSDDFVAGSNPCLVAADQVVDRPESDKGEVCCGQRGAVAAVADYDQRLIVGADHRVAIPVARVTGPPKRSRSMFVRVSTTVVGCRLSRAARRHSRRDTRHIEVRKLLVKRIGIGTSRVKQLGHVAVQ